ncbi:hypothetical protein K457DRAFT_22734 [Linnemannia elongata AG-77]|uniref:Uncharacterized protein n=1 Tax=Linnemannia elongata AG-77 TaxID=1314771 RepID=A0A197JMH1_9FUNG|nr:hypothetical protein K457DRAFT_22734 [Linnemannia elongata AG-77]
MLATPELAPYLLALGQGTLDPIKFLMYSKYFAGDSAWANTLLQSKAEVVNKDGKDDDLSTFYIGMTRKDPIHRADKNANSSGRSPSSRIINISKLSQLVCYEWIQLARPFVDESYYRQDSISQDIKRNLIAIGGSQLANPAASGFYYPPTVRAAKDRCLLELIKEHEQVVKVKGWTLAALITKDFTGGIERRRILEPFNEDLLSLCWTSTKAANDFVDLRAFSKLNTNTIKDRFTGSADFTPPRQSDPRVDFAKSSKATTKKNLLVLRDAIAKSVKTCGLEDLVEAARQAVRAMDSALTTAGMVARNESQADSLGPEVAQKAHKAVRMIGKPRTSERHEQVAQIEGRIKDKVSRGIILTKSDRSLFLAQYGPLSAQFTDSLPKLKEDVPLYMATRSCTPHASKHTVAGKAGLHAAQKKAEQQKPHTGSCDEEPG